jgi:5'-phosphate synthase pdxT subunit
MVIGVLALQGAFAAHIERLTSLGVASREVRLPRDLAAVDALVLPGGESTTMSHLLRSTGLHRPIAERVSTGMPVFGTCAGMILLSERILDGRSDQIAFGAIDITVRRNGYGRQIDSFETDLLIDDQDSPFHAVFIRAPIIESLGTGVECLARPDGRPVLVRNESVLTSSFHPELTDDSRIHRIFVEMVGDGSESLSKAR